MLREVKRVVGNVAPQVALSDQGKDALARLYAKIFPGQPELPRSE